jgi:hypothetical protein
VHDKEELPDQQYERIDTRAMSYIVLMVLVAVVGSIAALAWTSA